MKNKKEKEKDRRKKETKREKERVKEILEDRARRQRVETKGGDKGWRRVKTERKEREEEKMRGMCEMVWVKCG